MPNVLESPPPVTAERVAAAERRARQARTDVDVLEGADAFALGAAPPVSGERMPTAAAHGALFMERMEMHAGVGSFADTKHAQRRRSSKIAREAEEAQQVQRKGVVGQMGPRSAAIALAPAPPAASLRKLNEHRDKMERLRHGEGDASELRDTQPRPPRRREWRPPPGTPQLTAQQRRDTDEVVPWNNPARWDAQHWDRAETLALAGDTAELRRHLLCLEPPGTEGVRIEALRSAKRTLLHHAAAGGHLAPCVLLVAEFGFSPRTLWPGRGLPLHLAAGGGHVGVADYLISFDDQVSGINTQEPRTGDMPLHRAAAAGHVAVIRLLVRAGAVVDKPNARRKTPFLIACAEGRGGAARELLGGSRRLIDVDRVDAEHIPPVYHCIRNGDLPLLRTLVAAGALLNVPTRYWGPVAFAAKGGRHALALDVVRYLVEECSLPADTPDGRMRTPLYHAEEEGNAGLAAYLRPLTRDPPTLSRAASAAAAVEAAAAAPAAPGSPAAAGRQTSA